MIIEQVELKNFRSHFDQKIDIKTQKTAIIGKNGTGKTSFLEAIYLLCLGKSFRDSDLDLINFERDWLRVDGKINYPTIHNRVIKIKKNGDKKDKIIEVNHQKSKILKQKDRIPVVLFEPDDLNLICGSPNRRRQFFDRLISQYKIEHQKNLNAYQKALRQRNDLIKKMLNQDNFNRENLFSWNILLSQYGSKIIKNRLEVIEKINQQINRVNQEITNKNDQILIKYSEEYDDLAKIEQKIFNFLDNQTNYYLGTNFGPHRDDFLFEFNQHSANKVCSRGENRSLILALKIIENEIIKQELNKKPIILLDDVLSELDSERQKYLMKYTNDSQIFLTSNNVNNLSDYQIIEL